MEKCSFRLEPCAYQSSGMEEGSDTSQTGWREEMCDTVCVSVRICGVDQEWEMAEGDDGFEFFS